MFWRSYYAIKKNNYLKVSTILIIICSISAITLNIEGSKCISQINSSINSAGQTNKGEIELEPLNEEQQHQQQEAVRESFELRRYCFVVTNLYVYSLYGIIIGLIILAIWYMKYKQLWSRRSKAHR